MRRIQNRPSLSPAHDQRGSSGETPSSVARSSAARSDTQSATGCSAGRPARRLRDTGSRARLPTISVTNSYTPARWSPSWATSQPGQPGTGASGWSRTAARKASESVARS
jgi:hypothetical protein